MQIGGEDLDLIGKKAKPLIRTEESIHLIQPSEVTDHQNRKEPVLTWTDLHHASRTQYDHRDQDPREREREGGTGESGSRLMDLGLEAGTRRRRGRRVRQGREERKGGGTAERQLGGGGGGEGKANQFSPGWTSTCSQEPIRPLIAEFGREGGTGKSGR
jgi:hypothetical protein